MSTEKSSMESKRSFITGIATGAGIIIILGGVYLLGAHFGGGSAKLANNAGTVPTTGTQPTQPTQPTADVSRIAPVTSSDHIRGDQNASITMIEYSDFQCPYCSAFRSTVEQALAEYPGDVRLVYRHFPLRSIHPQAQKAAEASECANDQGEFWEMHDRLFDLNEAGSLTVPAMKTAAAEIGLNTSTFDDCLDSGKYAAEVEKDYQDGIAGGVTGTPGTFINDQYVPGALPFAQVQAVIESLL